MAVSSISEVERFVETTRDVVFLREVDRILIIRPNKLQHVNETAFHMLFALYHRNKRSAEVLRELSRQFSSQILWRRQSQPDCAVFLSALKPLITTILWNKRNITI